MLGLIWRIDPAIAAPFLEGTGLEVWPIFGKAIAAMNAWEYRESSIGPYGEVGIGIYAKLKGSKPSLAAHAMSLRGPESVGIYVLNLPVTTQGAFTAGVEIWGYPKYIATINTRFDSQGVNVRLGDELTMSMGKSGMLKTPGIPILTLTQKKGQIIRSVIECDHTLRWGGSGTAKIEIHGEGPCTKTVRGLGLHTTKPFAAFRTDRFTALLPEGKAVG